MAIRTNTTEETTTSAVSGARMNARYIVSFETTANPSSGPWTPSTLMFLTTKAMDEWINTAEKSAYFRGISYKVGKAVSE